MPGGIPIPPIPILAPIGSIAAWLKSYTNTPALPPGWVECNGQTLSDVDSVYNGQVIPNLNSSGINTDATRMFLRGCTTSGGTGGEATHQLTVGELATHQHDIQCCEGGSGTTIAYTTGDSQVAIVTSDAEGGDQPHNNLPPYYNVVWIMRVK